MKFARKESKRKGINSRARIGSRYWFWVVVIGEKKEEEEERKGKKWGVTGFMLTSGTLR